MLNVLHVRKKKIARKLHCLLAKTMNVLNAKMIQTANTSKTVKTRRRAWLLVMLVSVWNALEMHIAPNQVTHVS